MTYRLKGFVLAFVAALLIYCYGCKKTSTDNIGASIVGSWAISNVTEQLYVANRLTFDTTINPASFSVAFDITFLPNGFCTELSSGTLIGGAYTLNGNTLAIFDTAYSQNNWQQLYVTKLDAHNLTFEDTSSVSHDSIVILIDNFTR